VKFFQAIIINTFYTRMPTETKGPASGWPENNTSSWSSSSSGSGSGSGLGSITITEGEYNEGYRDHPLNQRNLEQKQVHEVIKTGDDLYSIGSIVFPCHAST